MYTLANSNAAFYHGQFCCCGDIRSFKRYLLPSELDGVH